MNLVIKKPVRPALHTALDQLFDDFFANGSTVRSNGNVRKNPAVNIIENPEQFRIELAAPGLAKEDFEVKVEKDKLLVRATKQTEQSEGEKLHRREFAYTEFSRVFQLPETVDTVRIDATYEQGILSLNLPKKEEAKELPPRTITIG